MMTGIVSAAVNSLRSRNANVSPALLRAAPHLPVHKIFPEIFAPQLWRGKSPKQLLREWVDQLPPSRRWTIAFRTLPKPAGANIQSHRMACDLVDSDGTVFEPFEPNALWATKQEAEQNAALLAIRHIHESVRKLLVPEFAAQRELPSEQGSSSVNWRSYLSAIWDASKASTVIFGASVDASRVVDLLGDGSLQCVWLQQGDPVADFPAALSRVFDLRALFCAENEVPPSEPCPAAGPPAWPFVWEGAGNAGDAVRALSNNVPPVIRSEPAALPFVLHVMAAILRPGDVVAIRADCRHAWGRGGLAPLLPPNAAILGIVTRWMPVQMEPQDISQATTRASWLEWAREFPDPTEAAVRRADALRLSANSACDNGKLSTSCRGDTMGVRSRWILAAGFYQLSLLCCKVARDVNSAQPLLSGSKEQEEGQQPHQQQQPQRQDWDRTIPLRLNRALSLIALARVTKGNQEKKAAKQARRALEEIAAAESSSSARIPQLSLWRIRALLRLSEAELLEADTESQWEMVQTHLQEADALLASISVPPSDPLHQSSLSSLSILSNLRQEFIITKEKRQNASVQFWRRSFA